MAHDINYLTQQGDAFSVRLKSGSSVTCYPNGRGYWTPAKTVETPPPVDPPVNPDVPAPEPGTGKWLHPLPGATITSPYGPRPEFHAGADLSTTTGKLRGSNIVAPCDMEITQAWEVGTGGLEQAGSFVKGITTSGRQLTWSFFHMWPGTIAVRKGQVVGAGTLLGVEGATGNITGTHLHLECWEGHKRAGFSVDGPWYYGDGTPIEPLSILRANGVAI